MTLNFIGVFLKGTLNKESLVRTLNEQIGPYEYNRDDNWTKKLSLGDFMSES